MTPEPEAYERWACELDSLFAHAWQRLTRGVHDRHAAARHPTLATVSPEGWPQARTVVLRAADKAHARLEIHTHLHSPKIDELRAEPRAAVHVWDSASKLQIRLTVQVEIISGPPAAQAWARVPDASRGAYSAGHRPGEIIASSLAYTQQPDPAAFAVLVLHLEEMDLLHLGIRHRRAVFSRDSGWAGQWRVP